MSKVWWKNKPNNDSNLVFRMVENYHFEVLVFEFLRLVVSVNSFNYKFTKKNCEKNKSFLILATTNSI